MIQFLNAATGTATTAEMLMSFLPMILIIVFMIILIYLPQKRQDKKDAAMRSSIEIGDKVTTIGGIVGIVCAIADKDDTAAPQSPLWRSWTPVRTASPPPSRSN